MISSEFHWQQTATLREYCLWTLSFAGLTKCLLFVVFASANMRSLQLVIQAASVEMSTLSDELSVSMLVLEYIDLYQSAPLNLKRDQTLIIQCSAAVEDEERSTKRQ